MLRRSSQRLRDDFELRGMLPLWWYPFLLAFGVTGACIGYLLHDFLYWSDEYKGLAVGLVLYVTWTVGALILLKPKVNE